MPYKTPESSWGIYLSGREIVCLKSTPYVSDPSSLCTPKTNCWMLGHWYETWMSSYRDIMDHLTYVPHLPEKTVCTGRLSLIKEAWQEEWYTVRHLIWKFPFFLRVSFAARYVSTPFTVRGSQLSVLPVCGCSTFTSYHLWLSLPNDLSSSSNW